jgi:hypothetical protein
VDIIGDSKRAAIYWFAVAPSLGSTLTAQQSDSGILYYTGMHLFHPCLIATARGQLLLAHQIIGTTADLSITTAYTMLVRGSSGQLEAGRTLFFQQSSGAINRERTGDYLALAVDEDGVVWGAGQTVSDRTSDGEIDNWGTVVFSVRPE